MELTPVLLEQFAEYWDWNEIIDCYHRDELYCMDFLEKYQDYIPASTLQYSRLWDKLVEDEKKQLKIRIFSYVNIKRPTHKAGQVYTKIDIKPSVLTKERLALMKTQMRLLYDDK